jgi:DNA mismatch repair protein MutL
MDYSIGFKAEKLDFEKEHKIVQDKELERKERELESLKAKDKEPITVHELDERKLILNQQPRVKPIVPVVEELVAPPAVEEIPFTYLGEAFRTYLIVEQGETLYFIDKHAAHERILYNKLVKTARTDAQLLLTPITVNLSRKEYDALLPQLATLSEAGFEAEEFDGTLLVRSVPMMLTGEDVPALIQEIAAGFLSGKNEVAVDKLSWIYHSVACRAAVKAGDHQSPEELAALAKRVLTDDAVRYCPHGRPVCFEVTKKELEKQFGRIV